MPQAYNSFPAPVTCLPARRPSNTSVSQAKQRGCSPSHKFRKRDHEIHFTSTRSCCCYRFRVQLARVCQHRYDHVTAIACPLPRKRRYGRQCCNYGAKDHALYQKPKRRQRCNKNIGMGSSCDERKRRQILSCVKAATGVTKRTQYDCFGFTPVQKACSAMERTSLDKNTDSKLHTGNTRNMEKCSSKENEDAIKQLNDKKEQEEQVEASTRLLETLWHSHKANLHKHKLNTLKN